MNYEMQELIPIVAELTDLYTSKESTSITYEKANQLMEAVLFCIQENGDACWNNQGKNTSLLTADTISAKEAYEQGRKRVQEKVEMVRELYNRTAAFFSSYGNRNYEETFLDGIPGFLKLYDVRFAPQNAIITMDYPILQPIEQFQGVDAIYLYVNGIYLEQIFLQKLPKEYVMETLERYHGDYRNLFCNISNIVLHELLKSMIAGKPMTNSTYSQEETQNLKEWIADCEKNELRDKLMRLLKVLIDRQYDGNEPLYEYLCHDMDDFAVELKVEQNYVL